MTTNTKTLTVHERCRVAPAAAAEHRLPLTYFDMLWLYFHPIQRLLFYPRPCSTQNFIQNIIPNLKNSLSKTLAHYLPLAGHLIRPRNSDKPELRYLPSDSVRVIFAESSNGDFDFNSLIGNQPRSSDDFHYLVPDLPDPKSESECDVIPLLAIQVTLFPETGISVGITNSHVAGDASSMVGFIKAWCSLAKLGENGDGKISAPVYDRSLIKDPSGRADIFWNQMQVFKTGVPAPKLPTHRFRATFVLQKSQIQMLRNSALAKNPSLVYLSSFTVTTSYVWACLARSVAAAGENVDDDELEYFGFAVDARRRLDPPLPAAYFGNCVAFVVAQAMHGRLRGGDGLVTAAELIGDLIANRANSEKELLRDADEWLVKYGPLVGKRFHGVAGSPRFDLYDADFGWGGPIKFESVSIDGDGSMSLCKSREFEGGLEIGLSLKREKMHGFATAFADGLKMARISLWTCMQEVLQYL